MRVIKAAFFAFALSCVALFGSAAGVEITPSIVSMPSSPDGLFSFDFVISDPMGVTANTFQSTITVSGPGVLTFDADETKKVDENPDYWVYGNSIGISAQDLGSNTYEFADNPNDPAYEDLIAGDIMARYAFTWDGTVGDYTFSLDLDILKSYVVTFPTYETEALQLPNPQEPWYSHPIVDATDTSFTVHIPEPTTLMLFGLGSLVLLKKRRA